jgi:hypothetical protein
VISDGGLLSNKAPAALTPDTLKTQHVRRILTNVHISGVEINCYIQSNMCESFECWELYTAER